MFDTRRRSLSWDIKNYPYFRKNEYWFFVERDTVQRGLDFVAQRKVQGPEGNPWGIWVPSSGKSEIKIGNQILGYKQKFEFFIKHKLNSGWYQIEYTRCANAFETTAVSHLVYDQQNEYVPYMNFHVY